MTSPHSLTRRAFLGRAALTGLFVAGGSALGPLRSARAGPDSGQIACWGDSLTMGAGVRSFTDCYPAVLATLARRTVYNGGRKGEPSAAIAARQGGAPARLATAVTLRRSGSVVIELDEVSFGDQPVDVTAREVDGRIVHIPGSGMTHRFTRASSGKETVMQAGTAFTPFDGRELRGSEMIIWAGHNDPYVRSWLGPQPRMSIEENIAAMVAYNSTERDPKYLVLSLINGRGGGIGTSYYDRAIVEVNGRLERTYGPHHYLDVHRYLVDQGLADAGIRPTRRDRQDMDKDIPPSSLRAEGSEGHLNSAGYEVLAHYIYDTAVYRW